MRMKRGQYGIAPATALTLLMVLIVAASPEAQAKKKHKNQGFPAGVPLSFETGGEGVLVPANLGVGPGTFPFVVGDGSGYAEYNGTPTGKEFHLNGKRVGDGWDQHFGAAQSSNNEPGDEIIPGVLYSYPIENAPNPIDPDRNIHIMKTRRGEVWFTYGGAFELDLAGGTLTYSSNFKIVGGTKLFAGSSGTVLVSTETSLVDDEVNPFADPVVAPFRYDFAGTIVLAKQNWKGSGEADGGFFFKYICDGACDDPANPPANAIGRVDGDAIVGHSTHLGRFTEEPGPLLEDGYPTTSLSTSDQLSVL